MIKYTHINGVATYLIRNDEKAITACTAIIPSINRSQPSTIALKNTIAIL